MLPRPATVAGLLPQHSQHPIIEILVMVEVGDKVNGGVLHGDEISMKKMKKKGAF